MAFIELEDPSNVFCRRIDQRIAQTHPASSIECSLEKLAPDLLTAHRGVDIKLNDLKVPFTFGHDGEPVADGDRSRDLSDNDAVNLDNETEGA